jgi:O-antigen/teichoic acid export membrane protein
LTRLLVPEYFGLMALLNTILTGLTMFSDIGVGASVTRDARGEEVEFLNTAWTIQVARGFLLWAICFALGRPAAVFYHEPRLGLMLPILGFTIVLNSITSIKLFVLIRHLAVREYALFEIMTQAVQLSVIAIWATIHSSLWALIGGALVSSLVRAAASHLLLPGHRDRLGWEKHSAKSIIEFGKWVFVAGAVFFLASQSDRLIFGRLVSLNTLALYGVAFTIADIPRQIILAFTSKVAFPFIAKFSNLSRSEFRTATLKYRRVVLVLSALAVAVVVNSADLLFVRVYDRRYWPAAWIIPVLALGLWHTVLYTTSSQSLVALGKSAYNAVGYSLSTALLYIAVPLVFHKYGLPYAVAVVAFSDIPMYFVNLYGLWKEQIPVVIQDLWATALFVSFCGAGAAIRLSSGVNFPDFVFLR